MADLGRQIADLTDDELFERHGARFGGDRWRFDAAVQAARRALLDPVVIGELPPHALKTWGADAPALLAAIDAVRNDPAGRVELERLFLMAATLRDVEAAAERDALLDLLRRVSRHDGRSAPPPGMSAQPEILQFVLPMMRGETVRGVQVRLAQRGILPAEGVDGLFGPKTRAAVLAFQWSCRLPATGLVDPATRARLFAAELPALARPIAEPAAVRRIVALEALPPARAARVVLHWTAGGPVASSLDRQHYHFIIEQSGTVVGGLHSIADNDLTSEGRYAAHTRGKNTGSVGIALCGMVHAREIPSNPARRRSFPCSSTAWQPWSRRSVSATGSR